MRRAIFNGVSPRSIITSPKPPLCKSRSVTRNACSTGFSIFSFFSVALCLCGEPYFCKRSAPHPKHFFKIHSRRRGRVRIESVADVHQSTHFLPLSRCRQGGQQYTGAAGRGRPANLSQASTRKSAGKRIDLADAARNHLRSGPHFQSRCRSHPSELGHCRQTFENQRGPRRAAMATGRPTAAVETSGKDDMETSGFQGTSGP